MIYDIYYTIRPLIPRRFQILLRGWRVMREKPSQNGRWPILEAAGSPPPAWPGWPGGKRFALVLTHDVESERGVTRCEELASLEERYGFRSAFGFIPHRYEPPRRLQQLLTERGFEIMVHGLIHDGKLYRNRKIFLERKDQINRYLAEWGTRGFCSPASHHNLPWISELEIDYDISTYDTDPFEPQKCGLGRIFPFWVQAPDNSGRGYVELPYTLPQDFTLFILMREKNNNTWRRKLDWIAEMGGMALIKTHPDYMEFDGTDKMFDRYPVQFYTDFLDYVRARYGDQAWVTTPSEITRFWNGLSVPAEFANRPITLHDSACDTCRQSHKAGRLTHYRPQATPANPLREYSKTANKTE